MTGAHDPPDSFRFNKLRESGGSYRLTLIKEAVGNAGIDPGPPRPVLAHVPAGEGVWVGFDLERFASQRTRVEVRRAVTEALAPGARIVGDYPVPMRGKLGSAIVTLPSQLVEELGLETGDRVTTVAVAPGVLLFVTEAVASAPETDIAAALEAARTAAGDGYSNN